MTGQDAAQALRTLVADLERKLTPAAPTPAPPPEGVAPLIHLLLYSFMLWESCPAEAEPALGRLYAAIIDPNELRVALPEEIAGWLARRDNAALDLAARLRAVLNDIYRREHLVSIDRLASTSKREAREYLDSLEGMPAYVAARVTLLGFGGHAVATDAALILRLASAGAVENGSSTQDTERWLERQIRASDAERTNLLFDAWRDVPAAKPAKAPAPRAKSSRSEAAPKATERRKPQKSAGPAPRSGARKTSRRPKKDS
ncbi:MAG: hypothetical protein IPJ41_11505 [Phycisphaerales bacterium]|nr:hypothetical protein [Phycisphaerales bacterium]